MRGSSSLLLVALLATAALASTPVTTDEGVYVLTASNFDAFIASRDYVLVEFYAPWCGHCQQLAPEYAAAAKQLAQSNPSVVLAKVDATVEEALGERFNVEGFPTIKLFKRSTDESTEYSGGPSSDEIVRFLNKRSGNFSKHISTLEQLVEFNEENFVTVVYFGSSKSDSTWSVFESVAKSNDDVVFGHVFNQELREAQSAKDIVLYKQFQEGRNDFQEEQLTVENLEQFIEDNSMPLVVPMKLSSAEKILSQSKGILLLFADDSEASVLAEVALNEAALLNKDKVLFALSKSNDGYGLYEILPQYIGFTISEAPMLILIQVDDEVDKYEFPEDSAITTETITSFVNDFVEGRLFKVQKSEVAPENSNGPVKVIVGKTFEEIVINSDADVLVEFYAPWCGHCKELEPIYEEVANKLSDMKNIIIAKIDATVNSIPGIEIEGYPTIKLFLRGMKDTPIEYEGDRTAEAIIEFIAENSIQEWSQELGSDLEDFIEEQGEGEEDNNIQTDL